MVFLPSFPMDWEIFYRVTLIPTCLKELTSKKEGNCNIIIIKPTDHRFHVIQSLEPAYTWLANFIISSKNLICLGFIFSAIAMSSFLLNCCYNLISSVPTRPSISTSFFWRRNLTYGMWAKQAVWFDPWLTRKDYLQTNAFPNLVMVEQEEHPYAL